jgi:hypothetical protein
MTNRTKPGNTPEKPIFTSIFTWWPNRPANSWTFIRGTKRSGKRTGTPEKRDRYKERPAYFHLGEEMAGSIFRGPPDPGGNYGNNEGKPDYDIFFCDERRGYGRAVELV